MQFNADIVVYIARLPSVWPLYNQVIRVWPSMDKQFNKKAKEIDLSATHYMRVLILNIGLLCVFNDLFATK